MLNTILLACAIVGGAIVLFQILAALFAFTAGHGFHVHPHPGPSHAASHPHPLPRGRLHPLKLPAKPTLQGSAHQQVPPATLTTSWLLDWLFGILNFQAIVAGIAVFGITGLASTAAHFSNVATLSIGIVSAFLMMLLVAALFSVMVKMEHDGTVRIEDAVGAVGTVYLSIPANNEGQGKVTLSLQQRTMEFAAVTNQPTPLSTGQKAIVVKVRPSAVMEVVAAEKILAEIQP